MEDPTWRDQEGGCNAGQSHDGGKPGTELQGDVAELAPHHRAQLHAHKQGYEIGLTSKMAAFEWGIATRWPEGAC